MKSLGEMVGSFRMARALWTKRKTSRTIGRAPLFRNRDIRPMSIPHSRARSPPGHVPRLQKIVKTETVFHILKGSGHHSLTFRFENWCGFPRLPGGDAQYLRTLRRLGFILSVGTLGRRRSRATYHRPVQSIHTKKRNLCQNDAVFRLIFMPTR